MLVWIHFLIDLQEIDECFPDHTLPCFYHMAGQADRPPAGGPLPAPARIQSRADKGELEHVGDAGGVQGGLEDVGEHPGDRPLGFFQQDPRDTIWAWARPGLSQ